MKIIDQRGFRPSNAWDFLPIGKVGDWTIAVHWTDSAYHWHTNEGEELFFVLEGSFRMHYREAGVVRTLCLEPGMACFMEKGDEHFAEPLSEGKVLVVEREGSP